MEPVATQEMIKVEKNQEGVTFGKTCSSKLQSVPNQDKIKMEPTSSVELLNEGGEVTVHEHCSNKAHYTMTSISKYDADTAERDHERVPFGNACSSKLQSVPNQDKIKVEPTSSVELLNEGSEVAVHEDCNNQAHSTKTSISKYDADTTERDHERVPFGNACSSKLQSVATQDIIKVEPTSSDEDVELLNEGDEVAVQENCSNLEHYTKTSVSNSEADTTKRDQEGVPFRKTCSSKFYFFKLEGEFISLAEVPMLSTLNEHQVSSYEKFQCKVCHKLFPSGPDLQGHISQMHSTRNPINNFHSMETVVSSMETSESELNNSGTFECEICKKMFSEEAELNTHSCALSENEIEILRKKLRDTHNLIGRKIFQKGRKLYECEICMQKFSYKSVLVQHCFVHTGENRYECDKCMKKFSYRAGLVKHRRVHTRERPYECEICKKTFSESGSLSKHKSVHTNEKPFECEICMKSFSYKAVLVQHRRVHTIEKPYECEICKKAFRLKDTLYKHRRVHTGEKPYECEVCRKTFSQRGALSTHRRIHTGEKPYECEICKKRFSEKSNLAKHRHVHASEKPYECEICMKKFSVEEVLVNHRRIHTEEKPPGSEISMKMFNGKGNLKKYRLIRKPNGAVVTLRASVP